MGAGGSRGGGMVRVSLAAGEAARQALTTLADLGNYNAWLLDLCRPYLRGRVLEAGCGLGTFSPGIAARARELWVLDRDPAALAAAVTRVPGARRIRHDLERPLPVSGFDTVVALSVLEHLEDDAAALRHLAAALAPGGTLLLYVPGHPWLYGSEDRRVGHRRRYRRSEILARVRRAGLTVVRVRRVNLLGLLPWLVLYRVMGRQGLPTRASRWFDRMVPWWRELEAWVPPPAGLGIFLAARKGEA